MISCHNKEQEGQSEPERHELLTVTAQDYTLNAEYPASIQGNQDIKIFPRVEGHLTDVYVKEGERVREGQLLFRIYDAAYRAAVESANANVQIMTAELNKAKIEFEGKKALHENTFLSDYGLEIAERDYSIAQANLAAAKAAFASARNDLSYTEIRSPSDGVVGRIFYRKGDLVGPSLQDGLTVVTDNRQMRVYFSMTESVVMQYLSEHKSLEEAMKQMPELRLQLPNGITYEQTGRVESISGVVDERTGAVSVCARFDNPDGLLLSGGTGKIVIPTELHNAIVIPQEATYDIQDKVYVVKVVDGKAVASMIQVESATDGKSYVVTGGLKAGEVIVAKGAGFVKEGTRIVKP
ncbi:MAG: efflux RND transporter periplasmic adaptor subunit [Bacteroidales bacterium]|nr:efflux RND transporter periplasmic adaptor subunit [Bacteroidales bacterium]